jgi:hypothetical protein
MPHCGEYFDTRNFQEVFEHEHTGRPYPAGNYIAIELDPNAPSEDDDEDKSNEEQN